MLISESQKTHRFGDIIFIPEEMKLGVKNETFILTLREKELLEFLCQHSNKALKREEILSHVWGKNDFFLDRSMDVLIARLRKYLHAETRVSIETIHAVGYRFTTEF